MNILLINSPVRLDAKPNCIPYGMATIASVLDKEGYAVEIFDINALRFSNDEIIDTLENKKWDVVGISGLITTYTFQKWLANILKAINPTAPIVSGGGLATSCTKLVLDHLEVDIAVVGEGEQTFLELCRSVEAGQGVQGIAGIVYKKDGQIIENRSRENISNLDEVPLPAWDLLPMEVYLKNPIWGDVANNSSGFKDGVKVTRSMNIVSSRGCPYACNYCYHLFGRSHYRFRSALSLMEEIQVLVDQYSVNFLGLVDDNMMASKNRLFEFCDLMAAKKFPITWGCHGRVSSAKPEVLERMTEAGCVWIGYGIESGSQKILDAMNKKATVRQAKEAISNTRKAGIYPNTTFIFGYPGETLETIQETVNFKRDMGLECGSFFATPYPGAPLYEQVRRDIKDEEAFIGSLGDATEFSINLTDFSNEELFRLKDAMDHNEDVI